MRSRGYSEVDVFSNEAYRGNALAVVHDGEGLSTAEMQRFAKWTNFSETTFLVPPTSPEADYGVRIFTPAEELPLAGHPTLGSATVWLAAGGAPKQAGIVVQESAAGLVQVRVDGTRAAFCAPPLTRYEPVDDALRARIADAAGIAPDSIRDASWIVNGPEWIGVRLDSAAEVLALRIDPGLLGDLAVGFIGPHPAASGAQVEVRGLVGGDPMFEDPVTGSLNAGLARWMRDTGVVDGDYIAAQGTAIGYAGRVHVSYDEGDIWVGGDVTHCIEGRVTL